MNLDKVEDLRICTKNRYRTEKDARKTARHVEEVDKDTKLRPYKCHICHNWHLTSRLK